jgi:hypothetical protein
MENTHDNNLTDNNASEVEQKNTEIKTSTLPTPEQGVQHDDEGNIIKTAANAFPPKAWKNQKKAYDDAFEKNKNQQLDDDF